VPAGTAWAEAVDDMAIMANTTRTFRIIASLATQH
jgi:hypothetical protein